MIEQWVKDIVENSSSGNQLEVGMVAKHPDGRTVRIVGGQYWGEYGVSNFWYWREVLPDGELGEKECGYWRSGL